MELLTKTLLENNNFRNTQNYIYKKNFIGILKIILLNSESYKEIAYYFLVNTFFITLVAVILKNNGLFIKGFYVIHLFLIIVIIVILITIIKLYIKLKKINIIRFSIKNKYLNKNFIKVYGTDDFYQI